MTITCTPPPKHPNHQNAPAATDTNAICAAVASALLVWSNHRRIDDTVREQALCLYAEGLGLRAIERILGVSHNSVMNWVRLEVAGKALERVDAAEIHTVEVDELWSFVGQKTPHLAVVGY